jgi:hypothetical protein
MYKADNIQFNSYLFTCTVNSLEANYKTSRSKNEKTEITTKHKQNKKQII